MPRENTDQSTWANPPCLPPILLSFLVSFPSFLFPFLFMPLSLPSGIFHLVQIKKVRKQDFQKEAQNFRLLTGNHEGGTSG